MDLKVNFTLYNSSAICITWILGLLLQERFCSPREQILSFKSNLTEEGEYALTVSRKYILLPGT